MEIYRTRNVIMKKFILITLFFVTILERTVFDLGPNIELITMAMILVSYYFGKKETFWLIFAILAFTDIVIGNTSIFIFTWSGFLIPALLINGVFKNKKLKNNKFLLGTAAGLGSNLFFYIWTNFGVWILDSWGMYPNNLSGLVMSYINGLPFLRMQVISTLLFVPSGFIVFEAVNAFYRKIQLNPLLLNGKEQA